MSWVPEAPVTETWDKETGANVTAVVDIAVVDVAVVDGDDGWEKEIPTSGGFS